MSTRTGSGHPCARGCGARLSGGAQVCTACRSASLLCQAPGCGKPHGGPPTTKLCPQCRAQARTKPRSTYNPPWTPEEDAALRAAYVKHNAREVGKAVRALFPTRPGWSITRRAQVLGAATIRTKEPRWTPEEDALLREYAWMVPERVAMKLREAGHSRSITAISIRLNRFKLREAIDGYSAQGLARMLDVDSHAVLRWIAEGKLGSERAGTTGDNHDKHHITTAAVRTFLLAHPEHVELGKLERVGSKRWYLALVTGGQISEDGDACPTGGTAAPPLPSAQGQSAAERTVALYGERLTLTALATICGRDVPVLLHRIDGLGMSVQDAAFGQDPAGEPDQVASPRPVDVAAGKALRALMRRHRAKPVDVAGWTGVPVGVVERMLAGTWPMVAGGLLAAVAQLDGDVEVVVRPKPREWAP